MKRFVVARSLSLVGDYAFRTTLILLLVDRGFDTGDLGLVAAIILAPTLMFYLLGGLAADRSRSKMPILIWSDIVRGVALVAAVWAVDSAAGTAVAIATAVVIAIGDGLFIPTSIAIIPELVEPEDLATTNSWVSIGRQAGIIAGPATAAIMIETVGFGVAFAFDAVTYFGSALLLVGTKIVNPPPPKADAAVAFRGSPLGDLAAPFAYLRTRTWLLWVILAAAILNALFIGELDTLIPVRFEDPRLLFPAYQIVQGVGALAGALFVKKVSTFDAPSALLGSLAVMAAALLGATTVVPVLIGPAFGLAYGIGVHLFNTMLPTLLQESTAPEIRGRVISLGTLAIHGLGPVGAVVVGFMGSAFSIPVTGAILFGVSIGMLAFTYNQVRPARRVAV